MYAIAINEDRNLVDVKLSGMLTLAEVKTYIADLGAAFIRHRLRGGYLMMIDTTEATLQRQEVVAALRDQIAHFPKARRIAMINGSSLARMQVRRVMTQPYTRICASVAEGRAWLFHGADPISDAV